MKDVFIAKIEILESGELSVTPEEHENNLFQFIYRAATGVNWNDEKKSLITPAPIELSYLAWYKNILATVKSEMGINLTYTKKTDLTSIPEDLKTEIICAHE